MLTRLKIFGKADDRTILQMLQCLRAEEGSLGVLCADNHVGYSQPVGGAVAYQNHVSPAGVGFDIGCGNKAAKTNLLAADVDIPSIMDLISQKISFGIGRANNEEVDDPVLDEIAHADFVGQRSLLDLARKQLGTVGSGNHYIDLLVDEDGFLWIGVHFGSRGFGHKTASGFLSIAKGGGFQDRPKEEGMDSAPALISLNTPAGEDYICAMELAGKYAYAGRNWVVNRIAELLGARLTDEIHNYHNFAWKETHFGETFWVVRKGCTPAWPGQKGFVGGSMGDLSVILEGVDSKDSVASLYSTVHGAGRVMSRSVAAGKVSWKNDKDGKKVPQRVSPGQIDWDRVQEELRSKGLELRGGGADEAPAVYKDLRSVLDAHKGTIRILHTLKPIGVAMAGANEFDPYKN